MSFALLPPRRSVPLTVEREDSSIVVSEPQTNA